MNASVDHEILRGNHVLLGIGSVRLLMPQSEVGAAEHLGFIALPPERLRALRFVALSPRLTPLPSRPPDRFLATSLATGDPQLRWCWTEVQVLIDVAFEARRLPDVLLAPRTPVDRYIEHEGGIVFPCSARRLRQFALGGED